MASWNDLLRELSSLPNDTARAKWLDDSLQSNLAVISAKRGGRNVIFYASAFLQKSGLPAPLLSLTHEELNGFMTVMHGMDFAKGLVLLLHTPGGVMNAAQTVAEYLYAKFDYIETIVPTYAMSAGTMLCLASNNIVMGRQSQLGPIDPQLPKGMSAGAVVDQFERARDEILEDLRMAHVWAPILQSDGPALLEESRNALEYGQKMVGEWLSRRMFASRDDGDVLASRVAAYFGKTSEHKSHGRRIDRDEARSQGVSVDDLEDDQELQDAVLTAYHLVTLSFEKGPATKMLVSNADRKWIKNQPQTVQFQKLIPPQLRPR